VNGWQEQARAFLEGSTYVTHANPSITCGAIAGRLALISFERVMGGPHRETESEMLARFAQGCRAFLAAYEAEK